MNSSKTLTEAIRQYSNPQNSRSEGISAKRQPHWLFRRLQHLIPTGTPPKVSNVENLSSFPRTVPKCCP
jgi:hypothetical protein